MNPARPSGRLSAPLKGVLGLAVSLLLVGVLELVLALIGAAPRTAYLVPSGPRLTLRPNLSDQVIEDLQAGTRFTVSTDADGLRRVGPPRPGARHRVLLLGDSIPFGWNLPDGQAMPSRLLQHLDRLTGAEQCQVINGAQPAFSSLQSLLLLERIGLSRAPTVVVVQLSQHDARPTSRSDGEQLGIQPLSGLAAWLYRNSRLYRLLRRATLAPRRQGQGAAPGGIDHARTSDPPGDLPEGEDDYDTRDYSDGVRVPMGEFRRILRRYIALSRERGFKLVFAGQLDWEIPRPYSAALAEETAGSGALRFDPNGPVRRKLPGVPLHLPLDPGHWNAAGSDAVAEALAGYLIKQKLVR